MEQTTNIQETEKTQIVKFQGQPQLLPEHLIKNLPEIVKREILHLKVNDREFGIQERQKATSRIINMFQMKFDDVASQELAMGEFGRFLSDYALTSEEILEAYRMAAKVELVDFQGEPIVFYPNLSVGQAGKILKAYQDHKIESAQHTKGINQIKAFLEPPKPELTDEEKKAERTAFYKTEYERLQRGEMVLGTTIFYELIKQAGLERISLKYVESVFDKYQPETFQSGLSVSKAGSQLDIPKKVTHNAKVFFIGEIVKSYIKKNALKELTEIQFIEHWENIKTTANV